MQEARPMALVTGASRGIGAALALECAAHGYGVLLVARDKTKLQVVADQITEKYGVPVYICAQDLAEPDAAAKVADFASSHDLQVEVLINNAGFGVFGRLWKTKWQDQFELMQVNMVSVVQLTQLLLPGMLQHQKGYVLNVGSVAGYAASSWVPLYYASKAFLRAFSEGLAVQVQGTGVSVSLLVPGPTATDFKERGSDVAHEVHAERVKRVQHTPTKVARIGFAGMMAGKRVIVPGWRNRILVILVQLAPRALMLQQVERAQKEKNT